VPALLFSILCLQTTITQKLISVLAHHYSCGWFVQRRCASTNTKNIFVNSVMTCMPLHKYRFSFLDTIFCLFHIKSCKHARFFHSNILYFIMEKYHEGFICKLTPVTAKSSYDRIRIIL